MDVMHSVARTGIRYTCISITEPAQLAPQIREADLDQSIDLIKFVEVKEIGKLEPAFHYLDDDTWKLDPTFWDLLDNEIVSYYQNLLKGTGWTITWNKQGFYYYPVRRIKSPLIIFQAYNLSYLR